MVEESKKNGKSTGTGQRRVTRRVGKSLGKKYCEEHREYSRKSERRVPKEKQEECRKLLYPVILSALNYLARPFHLSFFFSSLSHVLYNFILPSSCPRPYNIPTIIFRYLIQISKPGQLFHYVEKVLKVSLRMYVLGLHVHRYSACILTSYSYQSVSRNVPWAPGSLSIWRIWYISNTYQRHRERLTSLISDT